MRVRTFVALAHMAIAARLSTESDVRCILANHRAQVLREVDLKKFLRRGIGRDEARQRGLDKEIAALENKVQMINQALLRL